MKYRRAQTEGGTYFFTLVTHHRRRFLCKPENVTYLREAFRYVMVRHPFKIDAFVLLPDHLHCIWTLPEGDCDFSTRWRLIKSAFTRACGEVHRGAISASRRQKGEQAVWQRRFWEHQIRDERDLIQHVEYIHYNPVKHSLAKAPKDWEYSSFHRYVREGFYDKEWGAEGTISFEIGVGSE
ncbi:MAG: transposase [Anaerolineae bacterium]